jgi:hypothetical protein
MKKYGLQSQHPGNLPDNHPKKGTLIGGRVKIIMGNPRNGLVEKQNKK